MTSRKTFTIEEKAHIIWRLENGESNKDIAKELGVGHSTISVIWKNREKIKNNFETHSIKSKKLRPSQHNDVDQALLKWFKYQRASNIPISGPILQAKANDFSEKFGKPREITSAWIQRFRQRHSIVSGRISGESAAAPAGVSEKWLETIWPKLKEGYSDEKIYNADESGLFFKMTPERTLRFKGETCSGGKLSKERLTVLIATNMTGTNKKKLLVIGKSAKPRCFKNLRSLPVTYESNKKAWMTSDIFTSWLRKWDSELKIENDKILLLVDNCPAHPHVENLSCIKLVFLPPNTTAVLQPLDQGVIKSVKVQYRKHLILQMIQDLDQNKETQITILDAICMLERSWNEVSPLTIKNCFRHAGFLPQNGEVTDVVREEESLVEWGNSLQNQSLSNELFEDFQDVDKDLVTHENATDDDLVASVLAETNEDIGKDNNSDDDEDITPPDLPEVLTAMKTVCQYLSFTEVANEETKTVCFDLERKLQNLYYNTKCSKQTKITDFLQKK